MPVSTFSADTLLDSWGTNEAKFASLHSAYSTSGANELSGGSYARLAVTWSSASSNSKALSGTPYNFTVPASTVAFVGFWDALTTGNFVGMFPSGNAVAYAFSAPSSTSTLLAPGSSYASNQQVVAFNTGGSALPSGMSAGVIYFCKSPSGDSTQLSATTGPGSLLTLSGDGSGLIQAITPEIFAGAGTYTLSSASVSLI